MHQTFGHRSNNKTLATDGIEMLMTHAAVVIIDLDQAATIENQLSHNFLTLRAQTSTWEAIQLSCKLLNVLEVTTLTAHVGKFYNYKCM